MKKKLNWNIWFSALLVLVLLFISGCGTGSGSGSGTGAAPSASPASTPEQKELQKLTIMLDWYPNAVHSFLYAAQANGYFAEQGLEVQIQMPADTNDPLKLVAANKIDLALSYQPQVLLARGEKIPVKSIAAIVRHPLNHLMVPAKGPVHSPKDLTGKSIGYPAIPLNEALIQTMVKSAGGDPKQVKLVDVGFDLIPAISTQKVDAIMGGFINHEQLILEKQGHPVISLNPTDYGVPDYYELVLAASDQGIKDKQALYVKFIKAITAGQKFVQQNPDKALSILFEHEDKTSPLDKDIETKSLQVLLPLMDAKDKDFGYQDPKVWENVSSWLKDTKLLPAAIKAEEAFTSL